MRRCVGRVCGADGAVYGTAPSKPSERGVGDIKITPPFCHKLVLTPRYDTNQQLFFFNIHSKTSIGRPKRRLEDNIKMDIQEIGLVFCVHWIDLAHGRDKWRVLANTRMKFLVP